MLNRKTRLQQNAPRKGAHARESGMRQVDRQARDEGKALQVLYLMRPHAIGACAHGILWNTSIARIDIRKMLETQTQAKRMRRYLSGFFAKYGKLAKLVEFRS